jgi:hypothetical protein
MTLRKMKINIKLAIAVMALFSTLSNTLEAQIWNENKKCIIDASGNCIPNTILTAVPFLRINPDARSGGMGDAGLATSVDPNAMHFNESKLVFAEDDLSISATYTPWLRNLGIQDIYIAYLTGYKKIDDMQAVGFGLRYFSLGDIPFTDENGDPLGTGRPNEFEIEAGYARKLSPKLAASLAAKYIYSNLAADFVVNGNEIKAGNAFAADLGVTYKTPWNFGGRKNILTIGGAVTNLGSKIGYTDSNEASDREFLPGNLGIGAAIDMPLDEYNTLTIAFDLNKFLVPTPSTDDDDGNGIPDFRERSFFAGTFGSLADAPGGFTEEIQELMYSIGVEYWYDKQFAVRAGYFSEHQLKGNRKYLTLGIGLKYSVFGINMSYLVPTNNQQSPLANTLRFSLIFDFAAFNYTEDEGGE